MGIAKIVRRKCADFCLLQAVNKLAEIMNRKEFRNTNKRGSVNSSELKKKEKECRKLQQELTMVSTRVRK